MSETEILEKETYEIDGVEYKTNPSMREFIEESGASKSKATITKIENALKAEGIEKPDQLFGIYIQEIEKYEGISEKNAVKIVEHANRLMRKGNLVLDIEAMEKREDTFRYLPTGSSHLDTMLTYSDGSLGFRSKTMTELYGGAASGKSQICYTAACMALRPKEVGGWEEGVAYLDSEGAFELRRFKRLARYWGVKDGMIEDKFLYARASTFDDVENALNEIGKRVKEMNIGVIIIDSIMDPLKTQYPVGGSELSNLQPRQKHLKRVLDKLKQLAEIYNLVTIYTNHVRSNIGGYGDAEGAQGGAVIAHASDIRIKLDKPNKEQRKSIGVENVPEGMKMGRAMVVDSGFVGNNTGYYLIGPMGIADPAAVKEVAAHTKLIIEKGYICVDSMGNTLKPLEDDIVDREGKIGQFKKWLYGIGDDMPKKKVKSKPSTKKEEVEE